MNILAAKGTLAGVRMMLRRSRASIRPATSARRSSRRRSPPPRSRPAAKEEIDARRAAIAKAMLQSRPKPIRDRAIATLILEPVAHARELDDDVLEERYVRAASALPHPDVLAMLTRIAERVPVRRPR